MIAVSPERYLQRAARNSPSSAAAPIQLASAKEIQSAPDRGGCYLLILKAWRKASPPFLFDAILDNARATSTRFENEHARHPLIEAAELNTVFIEHTVATFRAWRETLPLLRLTMKSSRPEFKKDVGAVLSEWRADGATGLERSVVALEDQLTDAEREELIAEALQAVERLEPRSIKRPLALVYLISYLDPDLWVDAGATKRPITTSAIGLDNDPSSEADRKRGKVQDGLVFPSRHQYLDDRHVGDHCDGFCVCFP